MHIRERGNRVVFIRSWWDKELKKTMRRQVASCPLYVSSLPDKVRATIGGHSDDHPVESVLSESEMQQAKTWFKARRERQEQASLTRVPASTLYNLHRLNQMLTDKTGEIDEDTAFEILDAVVKLELELKRIGVNKGRLKERKATQNKGAE